MALASGVTASMGSFAVSLARVSWGCNEKCVIQHNHRLVSLSDGFCRRMWSKCRGLPEGCIYFAVWPSHPKSKGSYLPAFAVVNTPNSYIFDLLTPQGFTNMVSVILYFAFKETEAKKGLVIVVSITPWACGSSCHRFSSLVPCLKGFSSGLNFFCSLKSHHLR